MKYSVLMCVYKKENPEWFRESINSMLEQTVITDDFVIVKDGPLTDELEEVIKEYTEKYPDIFNIVTLEENKGLGIALSIGMEKCKNEMIARMDSDDISINTRCEKELEKFKRDEELSLVGSTIAEFIDKIENVQAIRELPETDEEIKKFAKKRNPFGHPSIMFKKSKVLESGNYRNYYLCEDYDMWIRMIENNAKCYNIQEVLVYMRIGADFYKRRGGIKYLRSILKFKKEQYKKGFYSLKDYIITSFASSVVCLMPNSLREIFYKKLLRK